MFQMRIPKEKFGAIPVEVLSHLPDDERTFLCSFDFPNNQNDPTSLTAISVPSVSQTYLTVQDQHQTLPRLKGKMLRYHL